MVVKAIVPRASVKLQPMRDTSISPRKDKYLVLPLLDDNEPESGNIKYSTFVRDTSIEIERVHVDTEAEPAHGNTQTSPFSHDIMRRLDVDTDSRNQTADDERRGDDVEARGDYRYDTTSPTSPFSHDIMRRLDVDTDSRDNTTVDERRGDVEAHGRYRHDTRDDGSSYMLGGELYTESSEDTVYYETKTHVSQTPRSLICEAFSFHREDMAIKFNLQVDSTMDESVNEDRGDHEVPSYVNFLGETNKSESSNYLNDLEGDGEARRGHLRVNTSAPTSPSPKTETVWSPKSFLCGAGGINEAELNDVIESFVHTLSDDSMEPIGDEAQRRPLSVTTSTSKTNLSVRMLTPKSPTGNQEVTFENLVHTLSDDSMEPKGDEAQRRPLSVRTSTPKRYLSVTVLTPKSPTGNQEVTFENNQSSSPKKKLYVRMLTPKSPIGNQEVTFENNHPLETSVGLTNDLNESNGESGCASKLIETSLLCSSPRAAAGEACFGLLEARELPSIVETLESNKSESSNNLVETKCKGHPVLMSASPTVARTKTKTKSTFCGALPADKDGAQECRERKLSFDHYSAIGDEGEVVWDANDIRQAMKNDVPMATCETFQQDKIYSTRKATKRTGALVEVAVEEAFWDSGKNIPLNRRHEHSRQKAAVRHEIRKEEANLRREQARSYSVDTVRDVLNDLCFIDDRNVPTRDVFELAVNLCILAFSLGRSGRMEGEMSAQTGELQPNVPNQSELNESEQRAFKRILKKRLISRASSQSKPVPRQPVLVQAIRDLCFMGPSERLVRFQKTLLLECKVAGMKANASARINNLKEEDSPVLESAQRDDQEGTTETAEVDHEYEKQIVDYLARQSVKESTTVPNSDSQKDQASKREEPDNAAVNKRKVSNAAKKKLKPFTRVLNKSLRSSHPSYPEHKFGSNAETVKAVRDLVFLDTESSMGYAGNTLLSETHAQGTKLLAAEIESKKRQSLDEKRDPDVDIDEGYEMNEQGIALRDLFFLDLCEGYALGLETHSEETKLLASEIKPLDEKSDPDVDIDEGREEDEHGKPMRDRALLDSESTEYEEHSLAAELHAKGTELLVSEIEPLDEKRDPTADIDDACELREQGQRERDMVSQDSESIGYEGNALAAELHAKRTSNIESRKSFDDKRGRSVDSDEAYEVNELELAFLDLLVESHQTATKLLAAEIKSRKRQSLDEERDPDVEVDAGYEVDKRGTVSGTMFSEDCESVISFSSDNAVATEALPIVPTSNEDSMIISTLDEDAKLMFQAGLFAFNETIVDDELRNKIDRNLTVTFDEKSQLIPASKELLRLYHVLKAIIGAEHKDQEGSASSPCMVDACQLGVPLEVMQDLQEWVSKCFSPK
jgi:hypothetical protein